MDFNTISSSSFLKSVSKGQSVKRSLFGPVDHEANLQFVKKQMKIQEEESRKKWNFDFKSMKPLPGPFVWEPIEENAVQDLPSAYKLPQLTRPAFKPLTKQSRPRTPLGQGVNVNKLIAPPALKAAKRLDFTSCDSKPALSENQDCSACDESRDTPLCVSSSQINACQRDSQENSPSRKRKLQQTAISGRYSISFKLRTGQTYRTNQPTQ